MKQTILITLNDQGGSVMEWNYKELASTLRAQMGSSHPPIVVYGLDSYNQTMSYEVMNPIRSSVGGDTKPMIIIREDEDIDREKVL